jgi:methyl-accepting chemotaxis protein
MLNFVILKFQTLKWPLRYKLGLAFALLLLCFIINGAMSVVLLNGIKNTADHQNGEISYFERVRLYQTSFKNEILTYSDNIFVSNSRAIRDSFADIINGQLDNREKNNLNDPNQRFEANLSDLYWTAFQDFSALQSSIIMGSFGQAESDWQKFTPDFDKVTNLLADWRKQLTSDQASNADSLNGNIILSTAIILGISIFSIVLVILLLFLLERVIIYPINSLQQALRQVATGKLDQKISVHNRDEVGELAQSFELATRSLQQVFQGIQISESLQGITQELATVSRQQETGSTQQVSALIEVMATMQELGTTAGQVANNAVQIVDLINFNFVQVNEVAKAGNFSQEQAQQMREVAELILAGVERIGQQASTSSALMTELNLKTEAINKIVGLINSIAGEVHIISINAAIEAAGVDGEEGARFGVVASSVKELAGRTKQAVQEVESLINEVQASSRATLNHIEQGQVEMHEIIQANVVLRENLGRMEQSTEQVKIAVEHLLGQANQVQQWAGTIKQVTQQQYIANTQVIASARSVEVIAEETANTARQIASSSSLLENLTQQLNMVLNQVAF